MALSRRLAVIMHRIWVDGTEFSWAGKSCRSMTMQIKPDRRTRELHRAVVGCPSRDDG